MKNSDWIPASAVRIRNGKVDIKTTKPIANALRVGNPRLVYMKDPDTPTFKQYKYASIQFEDYRGKKGKWAVYNFDGRFVADYPTKKGAERFAKRLSDTTQELGGIPRGRFKRRWWDR